MGAKENPGGHPGSKTCVSSDSNVTRWYDQVPWHEDPMLAYAKGMADGYQIGIDDIAQDIYVALLQALGSTDPKEAFGSLIRWRDQLAARGGQPWA